MRSCSLETLHGVASHGRPLFLPLNHCTLSRLDCPQVPYSFLVSFGSLRRRSGSYVHYGRPSPLHSGCHHSGAAIGGSVVCFNSILPSGLTAPATHGSPRQDSRPSSSSSPRLVHSLLSLLLWRDLLDDDRCLFWDSSQRSRASCPRSLSVASSPSRGTDGACRPLEGELSLLGDLLRPCFGDDCL